MSQSAVRSMFDVEKGAASFPSMTFPRDKSFKLIELGFLQILPAARERRSVLRFAAAGFDAETLEKLGGIYRRHEIEGTNLAPSASSWDCEAWLHGRSALALAQVFDCLSVLGSSSGAAVLGLVRNGAFRPGLIHCADRDSFPDWRDIRTDLVARGYACVGELEGAELFVDEPLFNAPDERPLIATFDVFDTVIARRCLEPWRIFEQVAERAGLPDFVQRRRAAEGRVIERTYVFDEIYDELARDYGWSDERRREVQALELACEHEAVIPIVENMRQVRDGDLLVSDMYLSEAQIRSLLETAGLEAKVGLFVESHGKSSGRVWPLIERQFKVSRHVGDNPHADVAVPGHFGIATSLTRVSDVNLVERTLLQADLRDLALLCREARLAAWHEDAGVRALLAIQTSVNLPLLILASVALARRAVQLGRPSLSFCSRDCNLWMPLFQAVQRKMGLELDTAYFMTSRIARKQGSETYLRYAADLMGPNRLVVDLCGTGWSLANLAERLGLYACDVFMIDHCPPLDVFERTKATPSTCTVHRLFDKRPNANNIVLELANQAEHGMVVDVRAVGTSYVPVLAPHDPSVEEERAVRAQRACFLDGVKILDHYSLADVLALDDASIAFLAASLYEYVSKQTSCFQIFAQRFLSENDAIVGRLIS